MKPKISDDWLTSNSTLKWSLLQVILIPNSPPLWKGKSGPERSSWPHPFDRVFRTIWPSPNLGFMCSAMSSLLLPPQDRSIANLRRYKEYEFFSAFLNGRKYFVSYLSASSRIRPNMRIFFPMNIPFTSAVTCPPWKTIYDKSSHK